MCNWVTFPYEIVLYMFFFQNATCTKFQASKKRNSNYILRISFAFFLTCVSVTLPDTVFCLSFNEHVLFFPVCIGWYHRLSKQWSIWHFHLLVWKRKIRCQKILWLVLRTNCYLFLWLLQLKLVAEWMGIVQDPRRRRRWFIFCLFFLSLAFLLVSIWIIQFKGDL